MEDGHPVERKKIYCKTYNQALKEYKMIMADKSKIPEIIETTGDFYSPFAVYYYDKGGKK